MMQSKIKGSEYKCEICYREVSKTNHGIPRHMLVVHLTCSKCNQSFQSGEEVKQHLVKKHRSVYSYLFEKSRQNVQCNRCQAEFARSDGLKPHKLVVHFECQECDEVFENKSQTLEHLKKTHPQLSTAFLEASLVCTKCPKKFRDNKSFKRPSEVRSFRL